MFWACSDLADQAENLRWNKFSSFIESPLSWQFHNRLRLVILRAFFFNFLAIPLFPPNRVARTTGWMKLSTRTKIEMIRSAGQTWKSQSSERPHKIMAKSKLIHCTSEKRCSSHHRGHFGAVIYANCCYRRRRHRRHRRIRNRTRYLAALTAACLYVSHPKWVRKSVFRGVSCCHCAAWLMRRLTRKL